MPLRLPGKKASLSVLAILAVLAGMGWWQKETLLSWHYVRNLAQAEVNARADWIDRIAAMPDPCLPRLLDLLRTDEPRVVANAEATLAALLERWGTRGAATVSLLDGLRDRFAACSLDGKKAALEAAIALFGSENSDRNLRAEVAAPLGDLLTAAEPYQELHASTLRLAAALLERVPEGQWRDLGIRLARVGLGAEDPDTKTAAIRLVLRPVLKKERKLLAAIVPLLKDSNPEVRKCALVALGPERDLVGEEMLLPLLHDDEDQVRLLCELALRSRGLDENHILLARLISDDSPAARLQVLQHLHRSRDLDPTVWLERLTQDPTPAVRAAAVRAAAGMGEVDFTSRLRSMSREDPSPTVRQLAEHYGKIHSAYPR